MPFRRRSEKVPVTLVEQTSPEDQDTLARLHATSVDPADLAIWIAAAELRVVTDRRLGKVTPRWVELLAHTKI